MGFPDLCRLPLSMLLPLLLLLAVAPVYLAQEHVPEVDQQSQGQIWIRSVHARDLKM